MLVKENLFMKKFVLLAIIINGVVGPKICVENKCSLEYDNYICPNANLTFIPIGAVDAEVLDLSGNYLPNLEKNDFFDFTRLKILILSNVSMKAVHRDAFRKLKNLEELDLSLNLIKFLHPDTFSDNILQHLNLSGNIFKRLVSNQFLTPHLLKLDLSNEFLETVSDAAFSNCTSLRWLNLSENKLETIQIKQLLLSCARLEVVMLHDNSWICDCDFYLMSKTPIIYDNSVSLRCETDREYKYANDTLFLQPTCEDYVKMTDTEIIIRNIEKNIRDEGVQDLILHVYGYMLIGITILVLMCCCCKDQGVTTEPETNDTHGTTPIIDHFYDEEGINAAKQQTHTFEKCKIEFHKEDSDQNEISVEKT